MTITEFCLLCLLASLWAKVLLEVSSLRREVSSLRDYFRSQFPADFPCPVPSSLRPVTPRDRGRLLPLLAKVLYPILPLLWRRLPSPLFRAAALAYLQLFGPLAQQEADRRQELEDERRADELLQRRTRPARPGRRPARRR